MSKATPSYTSVSGPPPVCFMVTSRFSACVKRYANILMTEVQRSLTCIGGCDADVAPTRMVL